MRMSKKELVYHLRQSAHRIVLFKQILFYEIGENLDEIDDDLDCDLISCIDSFDDTKKNIKGYV